MLLLSFSVIGADKIPPYTADAAKTLIDAAVKKAASESKLVFLKAGHPQCGWCVVFDRYHHSEEVQKVIEKYYVVVAIDTVNMPDGEAQFSAFAKVGAPSWVIIQSDRQVVIDSYNHGRNVGFPGAPEETAYYLAALKKATPAISDDELSVLRKKIEAIMK